MQLSKNKKRGGIFQPSRSSFHSFLLLYSKIITLFVPRYPQPLPLSDAQYAKLFAGHVKEVYNDLTPTEPGLIEVSTITVEAEVNHSLDDRLADAKEIVNFLKDGNTIEDANALAKSKGFNTYYHASRAVSNAGLPATKSMQLTAFSFGGIFTLVSINLSNCSLSIYLFS